MQMWYFGCTLHWVDGTYPRKEKRWLFETEWQKKGPVKTEQSLKSHKAGEAEREGKWKIHFHTSKPAHTWLSDPWPLELPECSAYFDLCVWYIHNVCVLMHALACNQRGQRLMSDVLVYNLLFGRQGFSLNLGARQVGSKPQQSCCLHPPQLSPCLLETQVQVCVLVQQCSYPLSHPQSTCSFSSRLTTLLLKAYINQAGSKLDDLTHWLWFIVP